ncbi:acyl-coenzyme A thioesterase 1-like isoform X1 [Lampris incognitus]|uniref:acyl-coenzyme A thioesterase 1-like isoform X1 n=1 Tax=Lampris incognitus TaxID=2546036 RepID=UPI0024B54FD6|nr:acyl-coenzyme A thioesterase 1-like isoform X1 [Lampris incognitus]
MTSQVRLRLLPSARCLYDDPIHVKVAGLKSRQLVVLKAQSIDDKGVLFNSSAVYRADGNGEIDLERDPSLRGSYTGVEPMGLLWSLRADTMHTKFHKSHAEKPHFVKFSVLEEEGLGTALAEITNERQLLADGVSRLYVKTGNIRGVLFTPPGEGPFPAVLDLYTFGGGLSERRACLLANRGFVVLTVALYGHDDLPKKVQELHLDYFEEAIEFLRNAPKVCGNRVGVISLSKSGDLALSIATYLSHVAATVWINGCNANVALPLYYRKRQILAALMFDISRIVTTESGALNIKDGINNPMAEENKDTLIPIEQAMGRFLFVAAADDLNWDSCAFVNQMVKRLKLHGKDNFESIFYPASGHYLEPPYGPYCPSSFHGVVGKPTLWGGEPRSHAAAEIHLWRKIQEFFKMHLISDAAVTKAML